jgi:RNA polymerase sigma-70 factor (ECF subfamily)
MRGPAPQRPEIASGIGPLEALYREHHAFVWRCVRRLGLAEEQVDDAVQDVFLVVDRRKDDFVPTGSVRSWLFAIAMRVVQAHRRREHRHRRRVEAFGASLASSEPEKGSAVILLHQLLEGLSEERRAVFILADLEKMSAPEIAAALGVKLNTVYSRLRAARAQVRAAAVTNPEEAS